MDELLAGWAALSPQERDRRLGAAGLLEASTRLPGRGRPFSVTVPSPSPAAPPSPRLCDGAPLTEVRWPFGERVFAPDELGYGCWRNTGEEREVWLR